MNASVQKPSCATCQYVAAIAGKEGTTLICRRFPPIPVATPTLTAPTVANPQGGIQTLVVGYHPPVKAEIWCGEWRMRGGVESLLKP